MEQESTSKSTAQIRRLSWPNLELQRLSGLGSKPKETPTEAPRPLILHFNPIPFKVRTRDAHWFDLQIISTKQSLKNNLGWTPDFIPLVLEKGLDLNLHDELVNIPDGAGVAMAQSLARNEGILTGISGGATMWAAVETAKNAPEGSVLVAMIPDTGERYLSTPLFASISADMNEEELAIARSTPSWILEP